MNRQTRCFLFPPPPMRQHTHTHKHHTSSHACAAPQCKRSVGHRSQTAACAEHWKQVREEVIQQYFHQPHLPNQTSSPSSCGRCEAVARGVCAMSSDEDDLPLAAVSASGPRKAAAKKPAAKKVRAAPARRPPPFKRRGHAACVLCLCVLCMCVLSVCTFRRVSVHRCGPDVGAFTVLCPLRRLHSAVLPVAVGAGVSLSHCASVDGCFCFPQNAAVESPVRQPALLSLLSPPFLLSLLSLRSLSLSSCVCDWFLCPSASPSPPPPR